jgi:muramoyltetrapeptide carboxypeptidase LdcA involved in peptidoglycan recycling
MQKIIPNKLKQGDSIMVIAPSDSLANMSEETRKIALDRFEKMGLTVKFANHVEEMDELDSSSIESRVADLHEAFSDDNIQGVITAFGGYNCNQLLQYLDWDLIKNNPKVLVGFSDTTALQNAIFAKTGLVTYSGPSFARFGQELYFDYTLESFTQCLLQEDEYTLEPSEKWSDDWWMQDQSKRTLLENEGWHVINLGSATGPILGANLPTFNLLQGTEYMPDISGSVLFLEDDSESKIEHFDRDLQSVVHLPNFSQVRGLVIGRFEKGSEVTLEKITKMVKNKKELVDIPVIANVDFGHTDPICTFPIGGTVELKAASFDDVDIKIVEH